MWHMVRTEARSGSWEDGYRAISIVQPNACGLAQRRSSRDGERWEAELTALGCGE